jgi:ubiquinone/menaquinone biosynthesis C-methylase UbiE
MKNIFESPEGQEFIKADNRQHRQVNNISAESQFNKLSIQLPSWLVQGKTVLDLGSCLGAAGYFALSMGALHYTGVEIQDHYHNTSKELFAKTFDAGQYALIQSEIETFLDNEIKNNKQYDIVVAGGILYAFLNVFSLLEKITQITKEAVVIDTVWLKDYGNEQFGYKGVIVFNDNTFINYANDTKSFRGMGTKVSPVALDVIMSQCGFFNKEKFLMPVRVSTGHDSYHDIRTYPGSSGPSRFTVRYFKGTEKSQSIKEKIVNNDVDALTDFPVAKVIESNINNAWKFDDSVAKRFQQEASQHIPDYDRVIQMCIDIANKTISKNEKVIDVGSALGNTVDKFIGAGYSEVYGVEPSDSMLASTLHKERILKSESFPDQVFKLVMINWTLHFVLDKVSYLTDVFNNMASNGTLIISDKTTQTPAVKELYYQFKRDNGVDQAYIESKEKQLKGIMHCMPAGWYVTHLESIGFTDVEVINSRFGFVSFMCRKP